MSHDLLVQMAYYLPYKISLLRECQKKTWQDV